MRSSTPNDGPKAQEKRRAGETNIPGRGKNLQRWPKVFSSGKEKERPATPGRGGRGKGKAGKGENLQRLLSQKKNQPAPRLPSKKNPAMSSVKKNIDRKKTTNGGGEKAGLIIEGGDRLKVKAGGGGKILHGEEGRKGEIGEKFCNRGGESYGFFKKKKKADERKTTGFWGNVHSRTKKEKGTFLSAKRVDG